MISGSSLAQRIPESGGVRLSSICTKAMHKRQYEAYPYPAEERLRSIAGSPRHIDEVNHYVFGGRRASRSLRTPVGDTPHGG